MQELRANTAVDVLIGPFVDDADGDTPITGSTLVVELSKNGQALATKNEGTNPAHDAAGTVDGYYNCQLDTTDTNTEGTLVLVVHHADSLPIRHDFVVLAEAAWDSKYVAKDDGFMDVNIKTIGRADTQETEADNLEAATAAYSVTRGLTGTALPAAAADAAGGVPISDAGALDLDAQIKTDIDAILTDTGTTLDGKLDAIVAYLDTEIAAIVAAVITNAAGADIAADIIALKAETATIVADTNELQTDDVPGLIGALNDVSAADVNAQVLDVLNTDTFAEPGQGAPPATASLAAKVGYLYKNWRNRKVQDATTWELYNDDAATVDQKAAVSDDGTDAEKGEVATGP